MKRFTRSTRDRLVRRSPRLEWLEARHLPSLAAVGIDPTPGAHLTIAPATLTVTFDRPIDPTSLAPADIRLARVSDDEELYWIDTTEDVGPHQDQLVLSVDRELTLGRYRLFLAEDSGLLSTDGETLEDTDTDRQLGDFWIDGRGVGLDDAIDLGTSGPVPLSVAGGLDFQANPSSVLLYKITLSPDHFWRLGVEVSAQRDGGTLDTALALFDVQGRPIATAEVGRRDAPFDPYLFAGLGGGTYYIGVSGTGNLPGMSDGYDPAAATPGSVPQVQPGGPFTLQVVADPVEEPPSLVSFSVDRADPFDPTPTGLTLGLSRAMDFNGADGNLAEAMNHTIEVVDESGRVWPVVASSYSEAEARVSFLFAAPLPEGRYTVRLPEHGGMTDLTGLSPVAPGLPPGVLGAFSVGVNDMPRSPNDRGTLLPDAASSGAEFEADLGPGESVSYRIILTFPSLYTFRSRYAGGALDIILIGPDQAYRIDTGGPDALSGTNDTILMPGKYQIQMTATGSQAVQARLTLRSPSIWQDLVLANGIGQGPALSLRLIAPPGIAPPFSGELPPSASNTIPVPILPPSFPPVATLPLPGATPPVPVAPDVPSVGLPASSLPASPPAVAIRPVPEMAPSLETVAPARPAFLPSIIASQLVVVPMPTIPGVASSAAPASSSSPSPPAIRSLPGVSPAGQPASGVASGAAPASSPPASPPAVAIRPVPALPSGAAGAAPTTHPETIAPQVPSASSYNFEGDLIGRPSASNRPNVASYWGITPGGPPLAFSPAGVPEGAGQRLDPKIVDALLQLGGDEAPVLSDTSDIGRRVAASGVRGAAAEEVPQPAAGWFTRLDSTVAWCESGSRDSLIPEVRDIDRTAAANVAFGQAQPEPGPDGEKPSLLLSPATIAVVSALLAQSHPRLRRWLVRRPPHPLVPAQPRRVPDGSPRTSLGD